MRKLTPICGSKSSNGESLYCSTGRIAGPPFSQIQAIWDYYYIIALSDRGRRFPTTISSYAAKLRLLSGANE
jgi:hypothetical protein